mmetsp:Transcript_5258/g.17730  ORF Transcript_5258/g.17730 Transcript_5258/m.17730 type:complete len:742 (+) Transcript_5258:480-2705(+)
MEGVLLLKRVFCDQVINVDQAHGHVGRVGGHPRELVLGLLDVPAQVESRAHARGGAVLGAVNALDHRVAPVHEGHLLAVLQECRVLRLEYDGLGVPLELGPEVEVLLVARERPRLRLRGHLALALATQVHGHRPGGGDGGVAHAGGVDHLAVLRPELLPLHQVVRLRRALQQDEGAEAFHGEAPAEDPLDGGHARVVPPLDAARVHKPRELALGQEAALEVDAREGPEVHPAHLEEVAHAHVLLVAVHVLAVAKRVGDPLECVHKGARKVVGGEHLVGGAHHVVRGQVAPEGRRVAQGAVVRRRVHLGPDAALEALLGAQLHLLPEAKVVGHRCIAVGRRPPCEAVGLHLLLRARVHEGAAALDHCRLRLDQIVKVVRRVRHLRRGESQALDVVHDGGLVLALLLGRVGVVKAEKHLALPLRGEVLVEERRLGVADVQEARGLRREARAHLAHHGPGELDVEGALPALAAEVGHGGGRHGRVRRHHAEPAVQVGQLLRRRGLGLLPGGALAQRREDRAIGDGDGRRDHEAPHLEVGVQAREVRRCGLGAKLHGGAVQPLVHEAGAERRARESRVVRRLLQVQKAIGRQGIPCRTPGQVASDGCVPDERAAIVGQRQHDSRVRVRAEVDRELAELSGDEGQHGRSGAVVPHQHLPRGDLARHRGRHGLGRGQAVACGARGRRRLLPLAAHGCFALIALLGRLLLGARGELLLRLLLDVLLLARGLVRILRLGRLARELLLQL